MTFQQVFSQGDPCMEFLKPTGGRTARVKEVLITNIKTPKLFDELPKRSLRTKIDEEMALDWQPYIVIGTMKMFNVGGFLKNPEGMVIYGVESFAAIKEKMLSRMLKVKRYHHKPTLKPFLIEVSEECFNHFVENDYRDSELYFKIVFQMFRNTKNTFWEANEASILEIVNKCLIRCGADIEMINFRLNEKLAMDHEGKSSFESRDALLLMACQETELVNELIKYARMNEDHVNQLTDEELNIKKGYPAVLPKFGKLVRRYLPIDIITAFKMFNKKLRLEDPYDKMKYMIRDARSAREELEEPQSSGEVVVEDPQTSRQQVAQIDSDIEEITPRANEEDEA